MPASNSGSDRRPTDEFPASSRSGLKSANGLSFGTYSSPALQHPAGDGIRAGSGPGFRAAGFAGKTVPPQQGQGLDRSSPEKAPRILLLRRLRPEKIAVRLARGHVPERHPPRGNRHHAQPVRSRLPVPAERRGSRLPRQPGSGGPAPQLFHPSRTAELFLPDGLRLLHHHPGAGPVLQRETAVHPPVLLHVGTDAERRGTAADHPRPEHFPLDRLQHRVLQPGNAGDIQQPAVEGQEFLVRLLPHGEKVFDPRGLHLQHGRSAGKRRGATGRRYHGHDFQPAVQHRGAAQRRPEPVQGEHVLPGSGLRDSPATGDGRGLFHRGQVLHLRGPRLRIHAVFQELLRHAGKKPTRASTSTGTSTPTGRWTPSTNPSSTTACSCRFSRGTGTASSAPSTRESAIRSTTTTTSRSAST